MVRHDSLGEALKLSPVDLRRFARNSVATAALCVLASGSWALGLGQIRVQSALGEALRAEVEVTSLTPEEAATLQARVATAEAYRAAGLEFNPVLPGTRVSLERRADGRAVLRLTGERAVQEPFVDLMLELTWATGRLVRQYTVLLDPPRLQAAPPPAPPAVAVTPAPPAAAVTPPPPAPPVAAAAQAPRPAAPPAAAPVEGQITVRRGDTLGAIAQRALPPTVSLEQMLVAMFQANPQAFIQNNMNLLRSGAVLSVPAAADAAQVPRDEALRLIRAQSADFNAFRQRLAGVAPRVGAEETAQRAAGQVQARVEERAPAATAADQLRLSQGAVQPDAPEARLAREAEQRDAATRVAELRRNVEDLERLQQAARSPAAPAPPAAAAPVAAPAAPATPPAVVTAAPAVGQAAAPAEPALPGPAVAVPAPLAAPPAAVTAAAPAPAAATPPPAAAAPGFMATLLDNPLVLPGAGALIALLAGLGIYRLRRRSPIESGETSFLESRGAQDSFFGATGGVRVDTRQSSSSEAPASSAYGLSQLDAIGDVDPVAEADVYLAYGRDLQAEEILKEAMRANPERLAIRTKLLEVYAKRRDAKGFESLATQLYGLTQGQGEDWLKAQDLGRQVDPDNALYRPGGEPAVGAGDAARAAAALGATTMPASVLPLSADLPSRQPIEPLPSMDVDLDLNLDAPADFDRVSAPLPLTEATQPLTRAESLDAGAAARAAPDSRLDRGPESQLDFELPFDDTPARPAASAAAPAPAAAEAPTFDFGDLSLDLDLPASPSAVTAPATAAATDTEPPMLDFGSLKGLDLPDAGGPAQAASDADDDRADPLQRKLELAEEFRQIGDVEGARDLLEEVVAQGGDALKSRARAMLGRLA
jgi:pilus assembly protein FimV